MENRVLMKWRKNNNLAIYLYITIMLLSFSFYVGYVERPDTALLIISLSFAMFLLILFATSFGTWNTFIYMNEEKIWIKKKDELIEWRFDDIIYCQMVLRPRWIRYKFDHIEITTKSNPKKLSFECNDKIEKLLLEITKGKDIWKIFHEAFK